MRELGAVMTILTLLLGMALALVPATAHAVLDSISELSVDFDIQPDGSVAVRYEVAWRFGSDGRHAIAVSIATRERWDADPVFDVVYDVSNLQVSSPTDSPVTFTQESKEDGSIGSIDLVIGDADKNVSGREATYVITYELRGAVRTLGGIPEFFRDVTGEGYPNIEYFSFNIRAPQGVQGAHCLAGASTCEVEIGGAGAVLTGARIPMRTSIAAAVSMSPGSLINAQPTLERRSPDAPLLTDVRSTVKVVPDGLTHVQQSLTYRLPSGGGTGQSVDWSLPIRRPSSSSEDQIFRLTNLRVAGAGGWLPVELVPDDDGHSYQDMNVSVPLDSGGAVQTVQLSYDVEGAVVTDGETAHASWILAPVELRDANTIDFAWILPGTVTEAGCSVRTRRPGPLQLCTHWPALEVTGATVAWHLDGAHLVPGDNSWITMDFPSTSVSNVEAILEPSVDAAAARAELIAVGWGAAVVAVVAGVLVVRSKVRRRRNGRRANRAHR